MPAPRAELTHTSFGVPNVSAYHCASRRFIVSLLSSFSRSTVTRPGALYGWAMCTRPEMRTN